MQAFLGRWFTRSMAKDRSSLLTSRRSIPFVKEILLFQKSMYLLYHHIRDNHMIQKSVKDGKNPPPKNQGFRLVDFGASKIVLWLQMLHIILWFLK